MFQIAYINLENLLTECVEIIVIVEQEFNIFLFRDLLGGHPLFIV